jgi:hypothetical protein
VRGKKSLNMERTGEGKTLDLAARAALAVHALVSLRDESLGGLLYFDVHYDREPAVAVHAPWDYGDGTGRYLDALVLAHVLTSLPEALDVAYDLAGLLMSWQGEMGLLWWPPEPWTAPGWTNDMRRLRDWEPGQRVAEIAWGPRGALLGLTSLCLFTGEERYRESARRIVDGLNTVALGSSSYAFYPEIAYRGGGWQYTAEPLPDSTSEWTCASSFSLLRFYAATGYEPALELAGRMLRFILHRARGFERDGSFHETTGFWNHFHSKSAIITAVILYGLLAEQPEYVAWGRQAYEAAKAWGTDYGWFPEDLRNFRRCETCGITDMIEAALLLGLHVSPAYLDDAQRYGRNHLFESQLLSTAGIARIPRPVGQPRAHLEEPRAYTDRDVVQRALGSFAGWSAPNDFFDEGRFSGMGCCNAAGTRALYDLWHHAVDDDGETARVHMAFDRACTWGDLSTAEPFLGGLTVRLKAPRRLAVRIPGWTARTEVQVHVNGAPARAEHRGQYLWLEGVQAGDTASISYPAPISSRSYVLGDSTYVANYRGDTIFSISPRGRFLPLYERDYYLSAQAPETNLSTASSVREISSIC